MNQAIETPPPPHLVSKANRLGPRVDEKLPPKSKQVLSASREGWGPTQLETLGSCPELSLGPVPSSSTLNYVVVQVSQPSSPPRILGF